jgi:putative Mg2+ transporter-C (MgtC) family protein
LLRTQAAASLDLLMDQFDTALRLLAATATGMALGLNRDLEGKPLGARTLGLVGMSSALVALTVTQIPSIAQYPDALSRAIQGIVVGVLTGIGFLGSGVILRYPDKGTVQNLTTAASIWATAALGVTCALASWPLFLIGTTVTLALLMLGHRFERLFRKPTSKTLDD